MVASARVRACVCVGKEKRGGSWLAWRVVKMRGWRCRCHLCWESLNRLSLVFTVCQHNGKLANLTSPPLSALFAADQYPADVMYHEEWTRYLKLFCEKKKRKKNHVWYECRLTLMTRCILPLEAMRECEVRLVCFGWLVWFGVWGKGGRGGGVTGSARCVPGPFVSYGFRGCGWWWM